MVCADVYCVHRLHEHDKEYSEAAKLYIKYLAMVSTAGVSNTCVMIKLVGQ